MDIKKYNQIIDEVYNKYLTRYMGYEDVPSKELFLFEIKNNPEFSEKWGLKIEERELTHQEKMLLLLKIYPDTRTSSENVFDLFDRFNIPIKLITLTYNNETIESYE